MTDISVGIFGNDKFDGGAYQIASTFYYGLYRGFKKIIPNTYYINDDINTFVRPDISISFGLLYYPIWHNLLKGGTYHFSWPIDNIFRQTDVFKEFEDHKNFFVIGGTPVDYQPLKFYYPNLFYHYIPIGTDPELWSPDNSEKCYDLVLMSSVKDYELEIEIIKSQASESMFNLYLEILDYFVNNPEANFWDIYNIFANICDLDIKNVELYSFFICNLIYVATYKRRINFVKQLKDYNLKIWGSPLWEKYIEGKVQYMGKADLFDAIDITRKSKIVFNMQTMQGQLGLPERVINSMSAGAFIISDYNNEIVKHFGDNVGYYENASLEDLKSKIDYYLINDEERNYKAALAQEITTTQHSWEARARYIMKTFFNKTYDNN